MGEHGGKPLIINFEVMLMVIERGALGASFF